MPKLTILTVPDRRLKTRAAPVAQVDMRIRRLMDDMLETMYAAPGIGLAAPQVGALERVIVVDCAREGEAAQPLRMANPAIVWASDERRVAEEGCLSIPDIYADVERAAAVRVSYRDHDDQAREIEAAGLFAACLQHEIDHLDGVLFIDHLSLVKRNMIQRRIAKARRQASG